MGARWTRLVTRRPLVTVLAVLAGLVVLAIPAPQLQLALPDNSTAAPEGPQRQAYDLISENFGPGLNGPLVVLVEDLDPATAEQSVGPIAAAVGGTPTGTPGEFTGGLDDVAFAAPTLLPDGTTAIVTVIPESGPQEEATNALVADLRDLAPDLERETGAEIAVTGQTAVAIDVSDRLGDALLPFALVVVGLALVLLLLVFRSILVPIKAAAGLPAVGRRLVRRGRRGLPVGLVQRPARRPGDRAGDQLPAGASSWRCCSAWRWTTRSSSSPACARSTCTAPRRATPSSPGPGTRPGRRGGGADHVRGLRQLRDASRTSSSRRSPSAWPSASWSTPSWCG